jgi:hypothetical protein
LKKFWKKMNYFGLFFKKESLWGQKDTERGCLPCLLETQKMVYQSVMEREVKLILCVLCAFVRDTFSIWRIKCGLVWQGIVNGRM